MGGCFHEGGWEGLCLRHPSPAPGSQPGGGLPGKEERGGSQFPRPTWEGVDLSIRSRAARRRLLPLPRADLTDLSSLQIFRRADKNGEFPSWAVPEEDLALSILML